MNRAEQFTRIRRFLRDPDKNIWSDDLLERLFNDVQEDIQGQTKILEELESIKVPPMYHATYMFDWEYAYLNVGSRYYQCFTQHQQANQVYIHIWEVQHTWELTPDVNDIGPHTTHPWEQFYVTTPADELKIRFPLGFHSLRWITYNKEPISFLEQKDIQHMDSSWRTKLGDPRHYSRPDMLNDELVLYPRPQNANWTDSLDGHGLALFHSADTQPDETGVVSRRSGSTLSQDDGLTIDIIDLDHNILMIFEKNALDLTSDLDESDYPVFLRKYIEYGVLGRAFRANTDGRIESLANYWDKRYELGLTAIKRFKSTRKTDRKYRLGPAGQRQRHPRHPRLPSNYPNVN